MYNSAASRADPIKPVEGFTLVESLLSVVLLGLIAAGVTGLYYSGLQAINDQSVQALLDSQLRSRMEQLISTKFDQLPNGTNSETVTVNGGSYKIKWKAEDIDLDGDTITEEGVKQIDVYLDSDEDHSLTTIVVDNVDRVGKI